MAEENASIPLGCCQCGCGERTTLGRGKVPRRFRAGHWRRRRFWSLARRGRPDECWPWIGSRFKNGYGCYRRNYAHRKAYELQHGPIPEGAHICHRCDNPPCVNGAHLYAGDPATNARDASVRGRNYHGVRHRCSKLNPDDVRAIRARLDAGETQKDIARDYPVHRVTIGVLARGRTWKSVLGKPEFP